MGAYTSNSDDLAERGFYEDESPWVNLNKMFLALAIFQLIICVIDIAIICLGCVYTHLYLMWIEDVIIEIPLIIIAIYLESFIQSEYTVFFVLVGGVLGLFIAIADTCIEMEGRW